MISYEIESDLRILQKIRNKSKSVKVKVKIKLNIEKEMKE